MTVTANGDARAAAVAEWQTAAAEGVQMTGAELAEQFGRSPSWGRSVAREARQLAAPTAPDNQVTPQPAGAPAPAAPAGRQEPVPAWVGWITVAAVLAVALAAAVASVDHLAELALLGGAAGWRAWLLPASLDGLVVASSMCLYRAHLLNEPAGFLPWVSLSAGLAASVVGNIVSVYPELADVGTLKIVVGGSPPIALALAFDLALRQVRASQPAATGQVVPFGQ